MLKLFAILAFFVAAAPAKAAENTVTAPVQLQLGGFMKWYVAGAYNKHTPAGTDYNRADVLGDAEFYFKGSAALTETFKIGVMAQLEGGTDDSYKKRAWDEVYMYLDGTFGRVFLGNVKNAGVKLSVGAPTASFIGVEESDFTYLMSVPETVSYLDASYAKGPDSLAPKVMYFSPTYKGIMFGVSVVGASNANGQDASVLYPENVSNGGFKVKNGINAVGRYDVMNDDGDFGVSFSATYSRFEPNELLSHAVQNFSTGINVTVGNFTVGGAVRRSLADAQSSFGKTQGFLWEAGILYDAKHWAASVNVLSSRVRGDIDVDGDDKYTLYIASYKYRLGAGIDAFVEAAYTNARDETKQDGLSNKAFGGVTGVSLSF